MYVCAKVFKMAARELTIKMKRDWAKLLYLKTAMSQKEICEKVSVTPKSFAKWRDDDNWELLKSAYIITKEQELRRIYIQINEINNVIEKREEGNRFASPKEADTISKLASAARNMETETNIANIVDTFVDFTEWLRQNEFDKAREFNAYFDSFIKHKLEKY